MKLDKCDKCCIGLDDDFECPSLVYEGFHGYLEESFSLCPHCGFELPEYVRPEPEPESRKVSKSGPLGKFNNILQKAYEPLIKEMFEPYRRDFKSRLEFFNGSVSGILKIK